MSMLFPSILKMQQSVGSLQDFLPPTQPPSPYLAAQLKVLDSWKLKLSHLNKTPLNTTEISTLRSASCRTSTADLSYRQRVNPIQAVHLSALLDKPSARKAVKFLPDYSHISTKVTSFRAEVKLPVSAIGQNRHKIAQLKIRNEMMMKNQHHLLRTMKRELKQRTDTEQVAAYENQDFRGLSQRISIFARKTKADEAEVVMTQEEDVGKTDVLRSSDAYRKLLDYETRSWRQKRGLDSKSMPCQVLDFIRALFDVLDPMRVGSISGQTLLKAFVALGMCEDPRALQQVS
jgi:hypothetical protein